VHGGPGGESAFASTVDFPLLPQAATISRTMVIRRVASNTRIPRE
jgi:hypothetical protein